MVEKISCPDTSNLEAFLLGKTAPPAADNLAAHVAECSQCATVVEHLKLHDTLIDALHDQAGSPAPAPGDIVNSLMDRLAGMGLAANVVDAPTQLQEKAAASATSGGTPPALDEDLNGVLAPPCEADELGRLGHYRILKVLGKGGMGVVFLGHDPQLDRQVAIKAMLPRADAAAARQRFLREARAAARVHGDHIAHIYQVGEERGVPYIAMEFLHGMPLDQFLKQGGKLSVADILRIGREVATGLAMAHERGLIHRDIKPANIWLDSTAAGRAKILDFGLARITQTTDQQLTQSGTILGTPAYMAPEQARGAQVDGRADLFSLGVLLYQLCTGELPFRGSDTISTLMAIAMNEAPPPIRINASLPPALSELVMRLLEKDPARRPNSATEVIHTIQSIEADSLRFAPAASSRPTLPPKTTQWQTGMSAPLMIAVALLLLALLPLGWFLAAIVLRLETKQGTLVVEIKDPEVQARIKNGKLILSGPDGKDGYTLSPTEQKKPLDEGRYNIHVEGADGLVVDTPEFMIKKGGNVVVSVKLQAPPQVAAMEAPIITPLHALDWLEGNAFATADISADGRYFTASRQTGTRVWETETGKQILEVPYKVARISADGAKLVAAAAKENHEIHVLDIATGKEIRKFDTKAPIWTFALSSASPGIEIVRPVGPQGMQVWDWSTGKRVGAAPEISQTTPDGRHLLQNRDGKLVVVDVQTGKPAPDVYPQLRDIPYGGMSADGKRLATGDGRGPTRIFDVATGKEYPALEGAPTSMVMLSGDGRRLVAAGKERSTFGLWDVDSGRHLATLQFPQNIDGGPTVDYRLNHDGSYAVIAADATVYVFRLTHGENGSIKVPWLSQAKLGGEATILPPGKMGKEAIMQVQGKTGRPGSVKILEIIEPPLASHRYQLRGRIRYESVEGVGVIEMWNEIDGQSYFTRTTEKSGPLGQLQGTSDWREIVLPFFSNPGMLPKKIYVNVFLPGGGTVYLEPLWLSPVKQPLVEPTKREVAVAGDLPPFALLMDENSRVEGKLIKPFETDEFTIETWITPLRDNYGKTVRVFSLPNLAELRSNFRGDEWTLGIDIGPDFFDGQAIKANTPVHLAAARAGATIRLFADGKLIDTKELGGKRPSKIEAWSIGKESAPSFTGLVHLVRISKTARYTTDFQPQKQLDADGSTLALYRVDGTEREVLKDASGNGSDGKIIAAKFAATGER